MILTISVHWFHSALPCRNHTYRINSTKYIHTGEMDRIEWIGDWLNTLVELTDLLFPMKRSLWQITERRVWTFTSFSGLQQLPRSRFTPNLLRCTLMHCFGVHCACLQLSIKQLVAFRTFINVVMPTSVGIVLFYANVTARARSARVYRSRVCMAQLLFFESA